jgi:multidrug efflux system membrane fusion protein
MRAAKILLPFIFVAAGVAGMVAIYGARPKASQQEPEVFARLVRAITVEARALPLSVDTQGTVAPRTEIDLIPEVSGRIVEVSDSFKSGGFFSTDEVLVQIDKRDYELAVASAEAEVAQGKVALVREQAEADVALREWKNLRGGKAPPLVAREPQLAEARARLAASDANLERAKLDLERTTLRASFDGRVREELVDAGQFVERGKTIARLYSVDVAEIRLPIANDELAYLELVLDRRGERGAASGPEVVVSAKFAGKRHEWMGRIVRTEGEVDPKSRMVHAVAAVEDPYGRNAEAGRPPLAVGMFVHARIAGRTIENAYVLPSVALRGGGQVAVVDADNRLRYRDVTLVRSEREQVVISGGLSDGDVVCISPLDAAVDGMLVRVAEADEARKP